MMARKWEAGGGLGGWIALALFASIGCGEEAASVGDLSVHQKTPAKWVPVGSGHGDPSDDGADAPPTADRNGGREPTGMSVSTRPPALNPLVPRADPTDPFANTDPAKPIRPPQPDPAGDADPVDPADPVDQEIERGEICTYTVEAWGGQCVAGAKAACERDSWFARLYPGGLSLGHGKHFELSTAAAVERALPGQIKARVLVEDVRDPDAVDANALATELVALVLNIELSRNGQIGDADFGAARITEGAFSEWRVDEVARFAEQVLSPAGPSDDPPAMEPGKLFEALSELNEAAANCQPSELIDW